MKPRRAKRDPSRISAGLARLAVPIRSLRGDDGNVRRHPERNIEAIKHSLAAFGQQAPVVFVVRGGRRVVIKGNGVLAAARELGWKHLAAIGTRLLDNDAKAFAIADNRTTDLSEFDEQLLAAQLQDLEKPGYDLAAAGFSEDELRELLNGAGVDAEQQGEKNAPKRRAKALSELYTVIVECKNERDQLAFYRRMQKEGRKCKLYVL
jgi:ParB-like chromosome segregation protein Spo0J